MSILNTDYFLKVGSPGTATTLSAPGYTAGGSTINVASTGSFPTDTAVIFAIDTVSTTTGSQVENPGSYCVFVGIVTSATSIGSLSLLYGTPQNYAAAATTRVFITVSSQHTNRLVTGLLQQHTQTGTHTGLTTDTITASAAVTFNGSAAFNGSATFTGAVTLPNATITPNKLATGATQVYVAASESTSSTTYTDLTTTTDTVTVTIGANGLAMVLFSATAFSTQTYVSFAMSGANTQAASDTNASIAAGTSRQGAPILLTGLTAGSTTFKLKYRVASGTGTFLDRRIAVIPL